MRCLITVEGKLRIEAEMETEGYALKKWYEESCQNPGVNEVECSPRHTLTLGPQPLHLLPANDEKPPFPPPIDALRTVYSIAKEHTEPTSVNEEEAMETVREWLSPLITVNEDG